MSELPKWEYRFCCLSVSCCLQVDWNDGILIWTLTQPTPTFWWRIRVLCVRAVSGFVVCFPFVLDWVNESVLCDWLVLMPVLTRIQQAREETPERRALRGKLDDFFLRGSSRSGNLLKWWMINQMNVTVAGIHQRPVLIVMLGGGRSLRSFGEMKVTTWKGGCLESRWWRPPKAGAMKEHWTPPSLPSVDEPGQRSGWQWPTTSLKHGPYRVVSGNFSQWKVGHAHA